MGVLSTIKMYGKRTKKLDAPTDLYAHKVGLLEGGELDLEQLRGKPTLIVNTASKCGLTPQFEGLQKLYEEYGDRGLQILGCPSADFAGQEHDDATATGDVCRRNYGVTFTMAEKMSVREDPNELWADINSQPNGGPPVWNFGKYLVGADGKLIKRWSSKVKPEDADVKAEIEKALS